MSGAVHEYDLDGCDREALAADLAKRQWMASAYGGLVLFNLVVSVFGWSGAPVASAALAVLSCCFLAAIGRRWAWVAFLLAGWPKGVPCHLTIEADDA